MTLQEILKAGNTSVDIARQSWEGGFLIRTTTKAFYEVNEDGYSEYEYALTPDEVLADDWELDFRFVRR